MKEFKIETKTGFVALPERLANYSFPLLTNYSPAAADSFETRKQAEKAIQKHQIQNAWVVQINADGGVMI